MDFEFVIPKRPVSLQTRKRNSLNNWKSYVRSEVAKSWKDDIVRHVALHLTLIFLYDTAPLDIDNIVKPIQDALVGLVYEDDALITDVSAHRRHVLSLYSADGVYPVKYPELLIRAILAQRECVYVRIRNRRLLEDYL